MSFWFTRFVDDPNAQTLEPGGIFTLGGTNSSLFVGDIDFVDIPTGVNPSFWLLPLMSGWFVVVLVLSGVFLCLFFWLAMTVQGNPVTIPTAGLAAIDTGTTLIGGPKTAVDDLFSQIQGSQPLDGSLNGFWAFRKYPPLFFLPRN